MIDIYLSVDVASATEELCAAYADPDGPAKLVALLQGPVDKALGTSDAGRVSFGVPHCVSNDLKAPLRVDKDGSLQPLGASTESPPKPETLVIPLRLDDAKGPVAVDEKTLKALVSEIQGAQDACADMAFGTSYVPAPAWCRGQGLGRGVGSREAALEVIGQDFLEGNGLDGDGVNVLIVDQGLDGSQLAPNFVGGWRVGNRLPGQLQFVRGVTRNYHGMLIARNVLSVAPKVRLWDCPLIPSRIDNVNAFLSAAEAHLEWVRIWIIIFRIRGWFPGPWVIVNAWSTFDRSTEMPFGHYSENSAHSFNRLMRRFAERTIDVVFAAGNCGQFCPDRRCGIYDIGPGASIYGAPAHASVLTVGATRTDGLWAGASSQGPGPDDRAPPSPSLERLARQKPDLCAPSFFADTHNAHAFNGGTSTASALAAGVVAALRGKSDATGDLPTDQFFQILRDTADRSGAPLWDGRLGYGMINPEGAYPLLP